MKEIINNIFLVSLMCSAAALAILLIRKTLGKRAGAWWRTAIWMVLLIRLCMPFNISSSIGMLNNGMFEKIKSIKTEAPSNASDSAEHSPVAEDAGKTSENAAAYDKSPAKSDFSKTDEQAEKIETIPASGIPANSYIIINDYSDKEAPKPDWLQILDIIYLCGFCASLIFLSFRAAALSLSLKKLKKCSDGEILSLFARIKKQTGVKKDIEILIDKNKSVPALAGILGTKIILPEKAVSRMSNEELEYVFIHELTHYKRMDILKLWFTELVLCLHWFNPILHCAKSVIRQDIELSCDENIVSKLKDTAFIKYCNVLMMSSLKSYRTVPGIITVNMAGKSGKKLKERLTMINNFSRKRIAALGAAVLAAASLVLVSCTTISTESTENSLGITLNEMNEKVKYLSEAFNLGQYNDEYATEETIATRWGEKTISYPLVKDSEGAAVFSLNYVMAKDDVNIKEIVLKKEKKDYDTTSISYSNAKRVIDISLLMDIYGVSNIGFFDFTNYRSMGPESCFSIEMIKTEDAAASYKITPYSKKEIEKLDTGLNITPSQMDEKIEYLMDNGWLDTELEFLPEKAYSAQENGKTVIKHPIKTDEEGKTVLTLEYTLAPDAEHIETITTKNNEFFSRELYQEPFIDLNLIAGKAYLLASENKTNLDYKIADGDKPIYVNDLKHTEMNEKENVLCSSLLRSNKNLYIAVIKSSRDPLAVLAPEFSNIDYHQPGLLEYNVLPSDVMRQISNLIDEKYIDTGLTFASQEYTRSNEDNAGIVSSPFFNEYKLGYNLEKITEYPVLIDENGVQILSIYFVADTYALYGNVNVEENISGYIKNIYVVYKNYLGSDDTDRLYKDLCILTDAAMTQFNSKTQNLPEIADADYYSPALTDWDMGGKLKIRYAPDHDTLFAAFDGTYEIPLWDNLPYNTDERHPHLGVTVYEMNEKLAWLSENHPKYTGINFNIETNEQERESERGYITTYGVLVDGAKYSFAIHSDGMHIKSIDIQLDKSRISADELAETENQYFILRDIIDTAFMMAKENTDSHENISSPYYPFPAPQTLEAHEELAVIKIFDNQSYFLDTEGDIMNEQQIITANPLLEIIYFE